MIRIGLSVNQDSPQGRDGMPPDYVSAVLRAGALPVIFPLVPGDHSQYDELIAEMVDSVDAIIFTGGPDFDPVYYGEEVQEASVDIFPDRDKEDLELLKATIAAEKPFLGICRGIQLINVGLGGSLYQDLPSQLKPEKEHSQKNASAHMVRLEPDTLIRRIIGLDQIPVNSRHHQAVKRPGKGLRISSYSEDGVIEAIEFENGYPGLGVQWHPENLAKERTDQQALFHWLVGMAEQCRR